VASPVPDRLRAALRAALKARDTAAAAALRSALAAIGNAEALPAPTTQADRGRVLGVDVEHQPAGFRVARLQAS
jgi:uncharacterized protein